MTLNEPSDPIAALVSDFARRRVLVLGDAMLDEYLLGDCSRISPEAPVPVLKVEREARMPGGAGNANFGRNRDDPGAWKAETALTHPSDGEARTARVRRWLHCRVPFGIASPERSGPRACRDTQRMRV